MRLRKGARSRDEHGRCVSRTAVCRCRPRHAQEICFERVGHFAHGTPQLIARAGRRLCGVHGRAVLQTIRCARGCRIGVCTCSGCSKATKLNVQRVQGTRT